MRFNDKVRDLLKRRVLTQDQLGEALGTSQQTVYRWLESGRPPGPGYLLKLARALGVSVDYLLDDAQQEPAAAAELSEGERLILRLVRALEMDFDHACRLLATPRATPAEAPAVEARPDDKVEMLPLPAPKRKGTG